MRTEQEVRDSIRRVLGALGPERVENGAKALNDPGACAIWTRCFVGRSQGDSGEFLVRMQDALEKEPGVGMYEMVGRMIGCSERDAEAVVHTFDARGGWSERYDILREEVDAYLSAYRQRAATKPEPAPLAMLAVPHL